MSGRGGIGRGQPRPGPPRPPMPQLAASMRGRGRATRPPGPPGTPSIRAPTFPAGVVPPVTDPYIPRNPLDDTLSSGGTLGGTLDSVSTSSRSFDTTGASSASQSLPADVSKLSLESSRNPNEPVTFKGQNGKPLNVTANYLRLFSEPEAGVFEYEIKYQPAVDMRTERFRLIRQCESVIGTVKTFDGVKLFLPKRLDSQVIDAKHSETGANVKVHLNYKKEVGFNSREMIQQLNIIFNRIFTVLRFKMHNRNFYDPAGATAIRQYNLGIWPGYVTAVDRFEGGLLLQCDLSFRVLRNETVRDALVSIGKKGGDIRSESEKALLGASVLTRYNNMSYKIDEIYWDKTPNDTFTNAKGEDISFMDYYKNQYGIEVLDPKQPLLVSRAKKKGLSEGEVDRIICLIPEFCLMTGLTDAMRADFKIMKEVANITRVTPQARASGIDKFVKRVTENPEAYKLLTNWGLRIEPQPTQLQARVLDPETLHFGKGRKEVIGPRGDWNRSATSSVLTPVDLKKWAFLFWDRNKTQAQAFCKSMQDVAKRMGIQIATPKIVGLPDDRTDSYIKNLRSLLDPSVQMVMTLVPQQKSDRYAAIKKLCCVENPVPSQVICLKTISNEKRLQAVAQKVVLQMNCKLGGELWGCHTPFSKLMVVGIDVFHDKSRKSGSIAGVVSSINDSLSRYYSTVAMQKQGQEIVDALKVALMESLLQYADTNNCWPETLIVFRDGVSDSQMDTVAKYEATQFLNTLRAADRNVSDLDSTSSSNSLNTKFLKRLPADYNPQFAYVVVKKRISTRILLKKGPNYENPPPGTVLDHTVTNFNFKDFFLVPQAVTQGTVTPTHMVVVQENAHSGKKFQPDDIQKLAYKLTHMYFNWPGTVRVPAPCQYAHKLVDLVGEHLHSQPSQELNDKLYFL